MYSLSHFQLPVCQAGHVSVIYRHRQGHIGSYFVVITGRAGNYRDYLLQFHRQGKNSTRCFDRLQAGQEFLRRTRDFSLVSRLGKIFLMKHSVTFSGGNTHD